MSEHKRMQNLKQSWEKKQQRYVRATGKKKQQKLAVNTQNRQKLPRENHNQ